MKRILPLFITSMLLSSSPYVSLTNSDIYSMIEYKILDKDKHDLFVLNQPFTVNEIEMLFHDSEINNSFDIINYWKDKSNDKINIGINPSLNNLNDAQYFGLELNGIININNVFLVNEIDLSEKYKFDSKFHGDTGEWLMGYFNSSYAQYRKNNFELFAGRILRNFGTLNDYGLILSNNPYAFDHYGFSVSGSKLKYSFYITRLNDVEGIDNQGVLIPLGETLTAQRYWSIQRLDIKKSDNLQFSFSESIIYGGPNQNFVASYLNPVNFFYASQRNQRVQLNSFWQINLFYKPIDKIGIFIDLFVDDIIVNNEPNINDRDRHPDRLGVMFKSSYAYKETLYSLRYVRIWNETYLSYRTFENYTFFEKGIGYPNNSYEGLKFVINNFNLLPLFTSLSLEYFRKGERSLKDPFADEINTFPVGDVLQGISGEFTLSFYLQNSKFIVDYNFTYTPNEWNSLSKSNYDSSIMLSYRYYLKKTI